ncbi:hypothetical protein MELE44368_00575 [Mycolicibacterium elephantis DSM 44368]|uniref:OmpR/PhoB-type domain-containing protein n=1 Tax=Mycolicibacterium elephantis DSM 44368 TaxID=1335622 RepID=A0A439DZY8_9MYCO|nr:hypothetical protein MELE44368_00575 [Mycolicibacterium elephantis DSM 44368]
MIRFGILGPLEVRDDGQIVDVGGPRQRTVLARLLLDPGRVVSADRLIEDVWNGHPPRSAAKTLQKYIWQLRTVLPDPVLHTRGAGYLLDVDVDGLDARIFERLLDAHDYSAALELWRGDVLSDLPNLACAEAERARLNELRMFAIESRLGDDLAAGRHAEAVGELSELVAEHPLRERFTSLLMLALYRSGRQVEALQAFDRHRQKLLDQLGVDPAVDVRSLQGAILRHDPGLKPPVPDDERAGNLPLMLSSFVGRIDEIASAAGVLGKHRLVTFIGPGGVGKTRLAVELGKHVAERFPGGVWLVDLAGVQTADVIPMTLASALTIDARHAPDELTAVTAGLGQRPPCLVILDNCEHVAEGAAAAAMNLLRNAKQVRILATSRRSLGVDGEFVRPVRPLPDDDATALFAERARLAAGGDPDVSPEVAQEVCRRVDGLPLAIELVASQLRVLHADELIDRLADTLTFHRPAANASPRQHTLADTVQWSHDLLPQAVRDTFARLGVFVSSFTLHAAETVCGHTGTAVADVLGHIATLVDHSLLVRDDAAAAPSRYRLLEPLRLFAVARLTETGRAHHVHRAHAEFFLAAVGEHADRLYGPREMRARADIEGEEPNIHAALDWARDHDPALALRFAIALRPYWEMRWRERYGLGYLESVFDRDPEVPDDLLAWALTAFAAMAAGPGEARRAIPRAVQAVDAFRRLGDPRGLCEALTALGAALGNQGRLDEADAALTEGLSLSRRLHDDRMTARLLHAADFVARRRGEHARAAHLSREEVALWRGLGSRRGEATALRCLAVSMHHLGDGAEATALCHRARDVWASLDDSAAIAHVQATLADFALASGSLTEAARQYDAALVGLRAVGDRRCTASTYKNLAAIAAHRGENRRAATLFAKSIGLRHDLGDEAGLAELFDGLAHLAVLDGRADDAATLGAAAAALRDRTGVAASVEESEAAGRTLSAAEAELGAQRFAASCLRGQSMSMAEVVDFALGQS